MLGFVNSSSYPFADEQLLAVVVSIEEYEDSLASSSDVWEIGGVPRESFASPWAVHSPRTEDPVAWQGRVTDEFVDTIVDEIGTCLRWVENVARNTNDRPHPEAACRVGRETLVPGGLRYAQPNAKPAYAGEAERGSFGTSQTA